MTRVKLIGLTGQSGAGKSTAAEMFAESGMTVINADALVAEIYESSPACLRAVAASFGQDIIGTDGRHRAFRVNCAPLCDCGDPQNPKNYQRYGGF